MTDIIFASTLSTILTIVILLSILISVGNECFSFATFVLALFTGFLIWKSEFFSQNWHILAYSAIAYIPIGVLVAMFKYKKLLSKFCKDKVQLSYHTPSAHSGDITGWIFYWPFVLIAYCFSDIFVDIKDRLFGAINGLFVNIYKKHQQ
jgi:hypothetical protein